MSNIPAADLPIPGAGTGACTLIDPADGLVANLPAERQGGDGISLFNPLQLRSK